MIYQFTFDLEKGLILEKFEGKVTAEGLFSALRRLREDSRFHADMVNLVDLRRCKLVLELEDLPKLKDAFDETFSGGKGRTAYLVGDPKSTALTMIFRKQTPIRESAVFSTVEKAMDWLGLPVAEV